MARDLDIVLLGATGFTGRVVAEHLLATYGANADLRWGLAGRDGARLEALRQSLGAPQLPLVLADVADAASMAAMAGRAKVVATTAGPYQAYGEPVVAACAAAGTDYVDITGETLWARAMLAYEDAARASGARITPFCGFDSIPFELGVWRLQREAMARFGAPLAFVQGRVRRHYRGVRGGMSGGSLATLMSTIGRTQADPALAAALADPFLLTPGFRGPSQPDGATAYEDPLTGAWAVPFMMATVNTKVVHRANLLGGHAWGADFRYEEMQVADGPPPDAPPSLAAIVADPARPPAPGEGPSAADREGGAYDLSFIGERPDGRRLAVDVASTLDASVGSTAALLAESAVCLARDVGADVGGGVWTAASAMGEALLARLEANASIRFTVSAG